MKNEFLEVEKMLSQTSADFFLGDNTYKQFNSNIYLTVFPKKEKFQFTFSLTYFANNNIPYNHSFKTKNWMFLY